MMNSVEKMKIANDIAEIEQVLCACCMGQGFDREKAIEIIHKHNMTEPKVALMNDKL